MTIFNTKLTPARALICGIALLVLAFGRAVPALPLFVKVFVPFPSLEDATLYEGQIEVVGRMHMTRNGVAPASYYIADQQGRHEIWCGLLGEKAGCFGSDALSNGAYGKVWFHQIYGALQWELTLDQEQVKGRRESSSIRTYAWALENYFPYSRYYWPLAQGLAFLLGSLYFFARFKKLLNATTARNSLNK